MLLTPEQAVFAVPVQMRGTAFASGTPQQLFSGRAEKWIVVDSKSPLFTSFRERHEANVRRYSALRRNQS